MWCQFQNKMYPKQSINIVLRVYQQLKRESYNDATNKVESDKNLKKRTSSLTGICETTIRRWKPRAGEDREGER